MTLIDARRILGLDPDQEPASELARIQEAREQLAATVREAANDCVAERYRKELADFDQALEVIRENIQAPPPRPTAASASGAPARRRQRILLGLAWTAVVLITIAVTGWIYLEKKRSEEAQLQAQIQRLERRSVAFVENRRWDDAEEALAKIEKLAPGSNIIIRGRESIARGIINEQNQHISYWNGQATAELEAGRLEEAIAAARQVTDKFPAEAEAKAIIARVEAAKAGRIRLARIGAARDFLNQRQWDEAIAAAQQISAEYPDDPEAATLLADSTAAKQQFLADQIKASELIAMALGRDKGTFDPEALESLREAKLLAPGNTEIDSLLEKFSSYTRTLRVPDDFATPAEAIANSRPRDRIVLAAGTWKGPLVINHELEVQGSGPEQTLIECSTQEGNVVTILPGAAGARITGIGFRHDSPLAVGAERFAVALVRGGTTAFLDCHFTQASGHGLAAIENGKAEATRCRFADNGWNGVAAVGQGCAIEVKECESLNNLENGVESWDGAAATVTSTRCEGNSRNGIHTDNGTAEVVITGNQFIANREFGLVISSAGSGRVSGNTARANLLGGFVVRGAASSLPFTSNHANLNEGPGLTLEKGISPAAYQENAFEKNRDGPILSEIELSTPPEER